MANRIKKYLIFILFSWVIYNSYAFFVYPFLSRGLGIFYNMGMTFVWYAFYYGYMLSRQAIAYFTYGLQAIVMCMFIAALLALFLWWRKQTLFRAWVLAFSGIVVGPGLIFIMPTRFAMPPWDVL